MKPSPRQSYRRRRNISRFRREYSRRQAAYMATVPTPESGSMELLASWIAMVNPHAAAILRGDAR